MLNQIEHINHQSDNLKKVLASHSADSDYVSYAFFALQAAKMGIGLSEQHAWATKEVERLHKMTLEQL